MSSPRPESRPEAATPVDDVRRIRERLSGEFGNDVRRLGEHARKVAEEYRDKLGLQVGTPTSDRTSAEKR
jgi:hypothetical protein